MKPKPFSALKNFTVPCATNTRFSVRPANQFGRLRATSLAYTAANTVGAGVLAVIAAVESQWGFLLLEGVWCILAAFATARLVRGPTAA